jgi:hypothetical protein
MVMKYETVLFCESNKLCFLILLPIMQEQVSSTGVYYFVLHDSLNFIRTLPDEFSKEFNPCLKKLILENFV